MRSDAAGRTKEQGTNARISEEENMKYRTRIAGPAVVIGAVVALGAAGCGGSDGDYPSENFSWIVPYSPGGGFDTYSRGFSEVMADNHLPDGVDISVENVTPLTEGVSNMYNADDDYSLGILPMPAAAAQEQQFPEVAQWDTSEFSVLGSIEENAYVIYVAADSEYETFEDLLAGTDMTSLTVERGSSSSLATAVAIRSLDLDAELTFGAEGSQEVATALVRGDVEFVVYGTSDMIGFVESGDIRPLLFLGTEDQRPEQYEWLTDVPSADDAGFPEVAGSVTELRVVVGSPNMSDDAVSYMQEASEATLNDPDFEAWAEEADRPLVPRDAESARNAMEGQVTLMQDLIPQLVEEDLL